MLDKKQIFKDFFIYSGGNYVSQGLGMVSGFLLRALIGPYYMGIWQGLNIIKSYASYGNFGVSKAAAREIAYFRGKNDESKADNLKDVSFTFSMMMVTLVALGCIAYALIQKNKLDGFVFWGLIAMGGIVVLERVESYIVTILRAKKNFVPESLTKVINGVLQISLFLLLVKNFQLKGLYWSTIIVFSISIVVLIMMSKEFLKFKFNKHELFRLIKIGIPLVLLGFMFTNLTNIDRIVILKMLGAEELGLYSIALMMGNIIYNLSNMAGVVLYPRFQEIYGRTDDKKEVFRTMIKVIKFVSIPTIALVAGGIFVFPFAIKWLLPKYTSGIGAMQILLVGNIFLALSIFCSHFLVTINKQMVSLMVSVATIMLNLVLNIVFVKMGMGIKGVALATSISYFSYFCMLFAASVVVHKRIEEPVKGEVLVGA